MKKVRVIRDELFPFFTILGEEENWGGTEITLTEAENKFIEKAMENFWKAQYILDRKSQK